MAYLYYVQRGLDSTSEEAQTICSKPWTVGEIREAYQRYLDGPTSFTDQLRRRIGRRYIVVGGHGLY